MPNSASFDEAGIKWKAGPQTNAWRMAESYSNRRCWVRSNDGDTIQAETGELTAAKDWRRVHERWRFWPRVNTQQKLFKDRKIDQHKGRLRRELHGPVIELLETAGRMWWSDGAKGKWRGETGQRLPPEPLSWINSSQYQEKQIREMSRMSLSALAETIGRVSAHDTLTRVRK